MDYMIFIGLSGLVMGLVGVAANPSPYFGALGLVVVSASGCLILAGLGMSFLSLLLFLIYLGGMLVVFAYSSAMAAESYPVVWGDWSVVFYTLIYLFFLAVGMIVVVDLDCIILTDDFLSLRYDWGGVALMYSSGGWMLLSLGWVLLLTLFVVLELTRGSSYGAINTT
uniref:NADH-ubiquinone oxidoreductase chain 6 n=1 Tax=Scolecomorphus vittatus TaxID=261001 RepID=Q64JP7_SCOVT|nr:NADH dehydrogenase subunit 6 [Scolecomorphus vittatus]AAS13742.1 NADH dehydrogenase subunit 6 [Scolecomorphus vittatus]